MAILSNTVFGELSVAVTDEEGGEVEIGAVGFEYKYNVPITTRAEAIKRLREIADWLEGKEAFDDGGQVQEKR